MICHKHEGSKKSPSWIALLSSPWWRDWGLLGNRLHQLMCCWGLWEVNGNKGWWCVNNDQECMVGMLQHTPQVLGLTWHTQYPQRILSLGSLVSKSTPSEKSRLCVRWPVKGDLLHSDFRICCNNRIWHGAENWKAAHEQCWWGLFWADAAPAHGGGVNEFLESL